MASSSLGQKNRYRGSDRNHPVDTGLLLALIRGQHLDNEAFVRQHLAECAQCRQNYASLKQISGTFDVLGQMAGYQNYPELSSSRMLAEIEERSVRRPSGAFSFANYFIGIIRKVGERFVQRPSGAQRRSVRWVSLPVAIILVIMTLAIMIALALRQFGVVTNLSSPLFGVPHVATNTVLPEGIAQHQLSPTPTLNTTPDVTVSPSSTTQSGATIMVCTNQPNQRWHILNICGSDFTQGDKVTLYLKFGRFKPSVPLGTARVNKSGNVKFSLWGDQCQYAQGSIYAQDETSNPRVRSNTLSINSVPGCGGFDWIATPGSSR